MFHAVPFDMNHMLKPLFLTGQLVTAITTLNNHRLSKDIRSLAENWAERPVLLWLWTQGKLSVKKLLVTRYEMLCARRTREQTQLQIRNHAALLKASIMAKVTGRQNEVNIMTPFPHFATAFDGLILNSRCFERSREMIEKLY